MDDNWLISLLFFIYILSELLRLHHTQGEQLKTTTQRPPLYKWKANPSITATFCYGTVVHIILPLLS